MVVPVKQGRHAASSLRKESPAMRYLACTRRGAILPRSAYRLLRRPGNADQIALRVGEAADDERAGHAVGPEYPAAAELLGTGERGLDVIDPDVEEDARLIPLAPADASVDGGRARQEARVDEAVVPGRGHGRADRV